MCDYCTNPVHIGVRIRKGREIPLPCVGVFAFRGVGLEPMLGRAFSLSVFPCQQSTIACAKSVTTEGSLGIPVWLPWNILPSNLDQI